LACNLLSKRFVKATARAGRRQAQEGGEMNEYLISRNDAEIGRIEAERATEALEKFCADADNAMTWQGGLTCDAATHGERGASVRVRDAEGDETTIEADMIDSETGELAGQ